MIDNTGKLGRVKSSARFKDNITPMHKASEAVLELKPVTFNYKKELDPDGATQFGLIGEQVEKIDPNLIVRDEDGKVSTVRYEAVNAMLLNEFLKEHAKMKQQAEQLHVQEKTIAGLKSAVADQKAASAKQQKLIEALSSGLQKVNEKIEPARSGPAVTSND